MTKGGIRSSEAEELVGVDLEMGVRGYADEDFHSTDSVLVDS
jgi:hypothetical protein